MTLSQLPNDLDWAAKANLPQVTLRSTIAGLGIGAVILISNFQFGLQTGWVSMMSLPSALLGFAIFKSLQDKLGFKFTDVENVFVQSVSVAVATGPLAYGFIGIIPALEKLMTNEESGYANGIDLSPLWKLVLWSSGVAFFGVFFAIPLRNQFVIKEKLPFPSGSATATLISVFHGTSLKLDTEEKEVQETSVGIPAATPGEEPSHSPERAESENDSSDDSTSLLAHQPVSERNRPISATNSLTIIESEDICRLTQVQEYHAHLHLLGVTSLVASIYTIFSYFVPQIRAIPLFGRRLSEEYLINFQPSPAYIGQGIIMGCKTTSYMLFGAILGWFVLSPLAKWQGWAPGPTGDWKEGSEGWIMWISLSIMISDSVVSLLVLTLRSLLAVFSSTETGPVIKYVEPEQVDSGESVGLTEGYDSTSDVSSREQVSHRKTIVTLNQDEVVDVAEYHLVPLSWVIVGLLLSCMLCVVAVRVVFGEIVPAYIIVVSVLLSLVLSILGVKALGETDLNPVSGVGKISQFLCAILVPRGTPGAILINLISGAISEATTQQAGDLMQDLKTGYLLGASPKAQFVAQIYGSIFSIFMSAVIYKVYNALYEIPGEMFKIPTAVIWIDCARLVNGTGLPPHVLTFSVIFGIIFGVISLIKNIGLDPRSRYYRYLKYLPDGVPVGIGIYNVSSFTFARFIGGLVSYYWMKKVGNSDSSSRVRMIIFSSGLVLGEGIFSAANMVLASLRVPHL